MFTKNRVFLLLIAFLVCVTSGCNTRLAGPGFYWNHSVFSLLIALLVYLLVLILCGIVYGLLRRWQTGPYGKSAAGCVKQAWSEPTLARRVVSLLIALPIIIWGVLYADEEAQVFLFFLILVWAMAVLLLQVLPSSPAGLPLLPSWFAS